MPAVYYVPLASMSPIHRRVVGHLVIAIQAYSDGSGKVEDPDSHFLTLSACIATPEAWTDFEVAWSVVQEAHGCPALHMKDAFAGVGDFEGWEWQRLNRLIVDLLNECFTGIAYKSHRNDFYSAICTVNLADYQRAAKESSGVRSRSPAALCAYHVTSAALMMLPDDGSSPTKKRGRLEIWFDQGEPFLHFVQKEWEQRKKRWQDDNDVLGNIITIAPAGYRDVIGLQAADFVAWHMNRYRETGDEFSGHVARTAAPI